MATYSPENLRKHMTVYSADKQKLGHIENVYDDSFEVKKGVFALDNYIPYDAIASVENDEVTLTMSADAAHDRKWHKRPDYKRDAWDLTELNYDRDHDAHDPNDPFTPSPTTTDRSASPNHPSSVPEQGKLGDNDKNKDNINKSSQKH